MTSSEKDTALFGSLLLMFQSAALQFMGKLKNPATEKIERDLEQAQMSIDMLAMLLEKTSGNLTPEAKNYLEAILRDLRLNYVDEVSKDNTAKKEST